MVKLILILVNAFLFVVLPVTCDEALDRTTLSESSGSVFNDGSFEFNIQNAGISIHVRGAIKEIEGLKTLVIDGSYKNTDTKYSTKFSGSRKDGFVLTPFGLSPNLVAALAG
ncbi:unnamed protein product [Hermetia illucens]|uniref:Uncharacterized protein n=1 Tax=Hermetia illucens TaxID=343691 RepID=A0A7R8USZ2_HERIL|nr:uncharacterized protein LOC119652499 [Hermetia illucens]CAD7086150.1 unnamed protein product [Hermetia illucens]